MNNELYWIPFKVQEEGAIFTVYGPYQSESEAMKKRETLKAQSTIKEYIGIPFMAKDKEEAEKRAQFY